MGAAKFIRGLVRRVDQPHLSVIVNTGDDEEFYGLHVSPDVDTVIYTLAGVVNRATGWGLEGESFNALGALGRFYGQAWFNLGDRDLATHLFRTERLRAGEPLSRITAEIARRFGVRAQVLPMSDDRVRTFVKAARARRDPVPGILRARARSRHGRANRTARRGARAAAGRGARRDSRLARR